MLQSSGTSLVYEVDPSLDVETITVPIIEVLTFYQLLAIYFIILGCLDGCIDRKASHQACPLISVSRSEYYFNTSSAS